MSTRTITLTGRPPVRINEKEWPILASASDKEHDGKIEVQANRTSKWSITVRQHSDGRTLVYAVYSYDTRWPNERCLEAKRGILMPGQPTNQEICDTIETVCSEIADCEHASIDASRWVPLRDECIADMPAETL